LSGAIQEADDTLVLSGLGAQGGVIKGWRDAVGFEVEVFEGGVGGGEDVGFESEGGGVG